MPKTCCFTSEHLSQREAEVLQVVAAGHTNKEVATILAMSVHTVDRHMSSMLRRSREKE